MVVFWADSENWTALTTARLMYNRFGQVRSLPLWQLRSDYRLRGEVDGGEKESWNMLQFPGFPDWIWTPSPQHLSLLLNVLGVAFHKNGSGGKS